MRQQIGEILKDLEDVNIFWQSSDDIANNFIVSYEEYAKTINSSKIWLATLAAFGDVTPRYYEVLGSGTLLLCQKIPESYRFLLKDGINCISFNDDLSDFKEKIKFYVKNLDKLNEITDNAVNISHDNCTWNHRAKELIELIKEI